MNKSTIAGLALLIAGGVFHVDSAHAKLDVSAETIQACLSEHTTDWWYGTGYGYTPAEIHVNAVQEAEEALSSIVNATISPPWWNRMPSHYIRFTDAVTASLACDFDEDAIALPRLVDIPRYEELTSTMLETIADDLQKALVAKGIE